MKSLREAIEDINEAVADKFAKDHFYNPKEYSDAIISEILNRLPENNASVDVVGGTYFWGHSAGWNKAIAKMKETIAE